MRGFAWDQDIPGFAWDQDMPGHKVRFRIG
jgi:hypothetical protein